ncbi:MAG: hypothetical protein Kow002_04650 [Anaerolineales bacterium]
MSLLKFSFRWAFKRAAYQILLGRYLDRKHPQNGRFSKEEVDAILSSIWRNVDKLRPEADIQQYKSLGNRQNLFLAVATRAAYHSFLEAGIDPIYAAELISDVAWKIYAGWLPIPRFFAQLITPDPQKQMNFILRMFLKYPFSEPGYQRKVWEASDHFCTYWYRCPPHTYFKEHGTPEEMLFFNRTWCTFDWAMAQEMVKGGRYEREHTLSAGDEVCDMKWYGKTEGTL